MTATVRAGYDNVDAVGMGIWRRQCQTAAMAGQQRYEVEFVDDSTPAHAPQPAEPAAAGPDGRRAVAAPVAWIAAAVLSVLATFQSIFTYRFTGASITSTGGYDAWGHSLDTQLPGEHGPRYALLLWVCAAAFALLAAALRAVFSARVGRWTRRHASAVGLCATTLLVGTLAGVALGIESSFASYRALSATLQDANGGVHLTIGVSLWFGLGSLTCAVAALVLQIWRPPTGIAADQPA